MGIDSAEPFIRRVENHSSMALVKVKLPGNRFLIESDQSVYEFYGGGIWNHLGFWDGKKITKHKIRRKYGK